MAEWKAAGRAHKDADDALWQRFRTAQDAFFARRSATFAERDAEFVANAEAKRALLAEAEKIDLSDPTPPARRCATSRSAGRRSARSPATTSGRWRRGCGPSRRGCATPSTGSGGASTPRPRRGWRSSASASPSSRRRRPRPGPRATPARRSRPSPGRAVAGVAAHGGAGRPAALSRRSRTTAVGPARMSDGARATIGRCAERSAAQGEPGAAASGRSTIAMTRRAPSRSPGPVPPVTTPVCRDQIAHSPLTDGDAAPRGREPRQRPPARSPAPAPRRPGRSPSEREREQPRQHAECGSGPARISQPRRASPVHGSTARPAGPASRRDGERGAARVDPRARRGRSAPASSRVEPRSAPRALLGSPLRGHVPRLIRRDSTRRSRRGAERRRRCRTPAARARWRAASSALPGAWRRPRACAGGDAAARRRRGGAARRRCTATSTTSPGRIARSPGGVKCTSRPSRARPLIRRVAPSLRPSPDRDEQLDDAALDRARLLLQEISSCSATSRIVALLDDGLGHLVGQRRRGGAGPRRVLERERAARTARRARRRASPAKSSSVSPGNPTMMSVVIAASGIAARTSSRIARYRARPVRAAHRRSTSSEPDCSGMCSCGQTFGVSAIAAITSEVKSRGCGEVKRTRSRPSIAAAGPQQLREARRGRRTRPRRR